MQSTLISYTHFHDIYVYIINYIKKSHFYSFQGSNELLEQLEELKDLYDQEIKLEKDLIAEKTRLDTEIQKNTW